MSWNSVIWSSLSCWKCLKEHVLLSWWKGLLILWLSFTALWLQGFVYIISALHNLPLFKCNLAYDQLVNALYWFCNLSLLYPYHFFVPLDLSYIERSILKTLISVFFSMYPYSSCSFYFIKMATCFLVHKHNCCIFIVLWLLALKVSFFAALSMSVTMPAWYTFAHVIIFGLSKWISQWKDLLFYE